MNDIIEFIRSNYYALSLLRDLDVFQDPVHRTPVDWPSEGRIEFHNVSMRYVPDGNNVLHKLDITIQSQEKVRSCYCNAVNAQALLKGTRKVNKFFVF